VRVRDATGALLAQHLVVRRAWIDFPLTLPADLPAGTFTLSTELDTGRTAERAFSVPSPSAPPAEVLIAP
jgi:hypothetical protein